MNWLALDIGGANIKLADGRAFAASRPFALWKNKDLLARELRSAIAESPPRDHLVVTMTGELADCFAHKEEGVAFILRAVQEAADGRHTRVYLVDGMLVSPQVALARPLDVASANWHALARFCARFAGSRPAWLIDIGSTTTDFIPLVDGQPVPMGRTDLERLMSRHLVYTGIERSPLCALVQTLPYRDAECAVAQELFATTRDVYLLAGDLPESQDRQTADQQPATRQAACRRLGRMLSATQQQFNLDDAIICARHLAHAQMAMLAAAAQHVLQSLGSAAPQVAILSGHGEFLARRLLQTLSWQGEIIPLVERLGPGLSRCATAHALAVLAQESTEH